jgi:hypothetical protein
VTEGAEGLTFRYHKDPPGPLLKEGVTQGWYVLWSGEPGPAKSCKAVALVDADGVMSIEQDGEWEDVTVTAD